MDHVVEDVQPLVQALTGDGAGRLDVEEVLVAQFVQTQVLLNLFGLLGSRQVLLVGQDQDWHLNNDTIRVKSRLHHLPQSPKT